MQKSSLIALGLAAALCHSACDDSTSDAGSDESQVNRDEAKDETSNADAGDDLSDASRQPNEPSDVGSEPSGDVASSEPPDDDESADSDVTVDDTGVKDAGSEAPSSLDGGQESVSADAATSSAQVEASAPLPAEDEEGLYALASMIFSDEGTTTFVSLLDSLGKQEISLDAAVEFPGWASIAPFDGDLFIANGESPVVTRYGISKEKELIEGDTVSFANYGVASVSFFHNVFFDSQTAHLRLEETSRILWNPGELLIEGDVAAPEIEFERDGLTISASNTEGIAVREDGAFWPYFWHDADWYEFHPESQIGVYQKDGSVELLDVPCPALNVVTRDEEDNLYYSGMVDTIAFQALDESSTLERCVAKINKGEQTIAEGWPRQFEELTDGRPVGRFQYLRDGIGVIMVFHEERATVDPADTFTSFFADHWALWLVDLEAWSAKRIEDWDFGSSNVFINRVGRHTFLHKVAADFSKTEVFEVDIDGSIAPTFTAPGYSTVLFQVR
jgi:hypothetical protein